MASVVNPQTRKRARPSNAPQDASSRRQQIAHDGDTTRPQKRNRPSTGSASRTDVSSNSRAAPSNSRTSAAALLRGPNPQVARNRLGGQESTTAAAAAASSRPSLNDVASSQMQKKPPPKRRSGQTKASRTTTTTATAGGKSAGRAQGQRRRQQDSSPDEPPIPRRQRRGRDGSDDEDDEDDEEEEQDEDEEEEEDEKDEGTYPASPTKPYAHVAPYTRRVRQSTIETKWSPLGRGSLKALTSILQLAHRPILQRLVSSSSESRRAPTEAALQLITKRILTKISGVEAKNIAPLPFPPASLPTRTQRGRPRGGRAEQDGGRETELNFESVLDAKQTLERQLDPVLHAVDLLGEEARRMEEELEADYETLRLLEAEARARARENRSLLKRAHPLAPEGKGTAAASGGDGEASIKFEKADDAVLNPFQDIQDPEIRSLVATLGERVDVIQDNMAQTEGISDQIQRTRASLQNVLSKKLSAKRYQQVVLGS